MTLSTGTDLRLQPYHNHASAIRQVPADLDLEGGSVIDVEEFEEVDPTDNCTVHVTRYHILSQDGTEESTITKRRKLKVNCTQSLKRIEMTNGKESKFEEHTTVSGSFQGFPNEAPPEMKLLSRYDNTDHSLNNMLLHTQDKFMQLLQQKRDDLIQAFPDLFTNLRSQPAIFEPPASVQEVTVHPDGSTTMRTKSSKAYSSHYTRQETYLNGVKQNTTSKFRAFMEYVGPEGGFCVRINDNPDDDLSEDEGETEDTLSTLSRINRSCISDVSSEVADDRSAVVLHDRHVPSISQKPSKRLEKAWHAVNELVESEARYVQKLYLLEKFRNEIEKEKLLDKKQMFVLFANTSSLYQFHNDHLLPQLMDRRREWHSTKKISDVIKKQGPFLKMYSEYTNNYKNSTNTFEEAMKRKRKFEEIVRKLERLPECENMSLVSHLICPVQRVMRYQLLLKEYQKHLQSSDPDYSDTSVALDLVVEAASHANEMMRKLDRYRNVLEVQELLGGSMTLVSPSRELLKREKVTKISSSTGKCEERILYVFNDLILLVSERTIGIGSKLKLRAIFDPLLTQICEGDNLEREHSFYLRGVDHAGGPARCVQLFCNTQNEKSSLMESIWSVINDTHHRKSSFRPNNNHVLIPVNGDRKGCNKCEQEFSWLSRPAIQCVKCQLRYCKKCFGQMRVEPKQSRLCEYCLNDTDKNMNKYPKQNRTNLLDIPATGTDIIKSSRLKLKSNTGKTLDRFFVLRKNFCLYSYQSEKDKMALTMLPIAGCEITTGNEKNSLVIRHLNRSYTILLENETDQTEWFAALVLTANAQIPGIGQQNNLN